LRSLCPTRLVRMVPSLRRIWDLRLLDQWHSGE
jgi:hypothetical protein